MSPKKKKLSLVIFSYRAQEKWSVIWVTRTEEQKKNLVSISPMWQVQKVSSESWKLFQIYSHLDGSALDAIVEVILVGILEKVIPLKVTPLDYWAIIARYFTLSNGF